MFFSRKHGRMDGNSPGKTRKCGIQIDFDDVKIEKLRKADSQHDESPFFF